MVSFYNELTCGSSCTNLHEVKNCHSKKLFRWILFWPCSKWLLCLVPLHCARAFDDVGRTGIGLVSLLTDKAPDEEEVGAETAAAWRSSNDHVMGILCMSAEEPVRLSFVSFSSAREMWEYLKQRYEHNWALKVTLMERHRVLRQQDMSIQEFTMCSHASHGSWTAWCWRPVMNVIVPKGGNLIRSFAWWTSLWVFAQNLNLLWQILLHNTPPNMDEALNDLNIKEVSMSAAHTQTVCSHCKGSGHTAERC
jgi:hypothetical protein